MTSDGTREERESSPLSAERPTDPIAARLYEELRDLASRILGDEHGLAVDATDLVHECYLKLARIAEFRALGRSRFLSLAASLLRRILVDIARRRQAKKRGAGWQRTTLSGASAELGDGEDEVDLLELDEALDRLESVDPRQRRIVELRFFAGLSGEEIALELGVSRRTVTKEWTLARAWLRRELRG